MAARGTETPAQRLSCITVDDSSSVVLGKEPVFHNGKPVGYVTSAAFGHTIGKSIAYAWLPATIEVGEAVEIEYFGKKYPATIRAEPMYDPKMTRLRDVPADVDVLASARLS